MRWSLLAVLLSFAASARAQAPEPPSPYPEPPPSRAYQLRLELDLPIVLIAGATASGFFFVDEVPGVHCAPDCDRSRVNALDRPAAGLYDPKWSTMGNVAVAVTMLAPAVVLVADQGLKDGLNDELVIAEAALVSSALQVLTSFSVARPRPRAYSSEASRDSSSDANAARSFFSGHVANVVATSVATLRTYQRLRKPTLGWTLFGVGMAGSAFVGVSRVLAGSHFPTDVLAGAAVGAGLGLALPALHDSPVRMVPYASRENTGLMFVGALD